MESAPIHDTVTPLPSEMASYTTIRQPMIKPMQHIPAPIPPQLSPMPPIPQQLPPQFVPQQFTKTTPLSAPPQRDPNPHPRNVYAASLPNDFTQQELVELFTPFGPIESARIVSRNPNQTGRRTYAFVLFMDEGGAAASVRQLQTATVRGQRIQVRLSRNRDVGENYFAPTPGAIHTSVPPPPAPAPAPMANVVYTQPPQGVMVQQATSAHSSYYVPQGVSSPSAPQPTQWGQAHAPPPNVVYLAGQQQQQAPPPPPPGTSAAPPAMFMMPVHGQMPAQPPQTTPAGFTGLNPVER